MNKILSIFLAAAVFFGIFYFLQNFIETPTRDAVDFNEQGLSQELEIQPDSQTEGSIRIVWIKVEVNEKIFLFNNLDAKLTSLEAMTTNQCSSLVSSFFYDSEMRPLGLVISESEIVSNQRQSSLLNGYFLIDENNNAKITKEAQQNARIAVQSGPLIMLDSENLNIVSRTKENSRRIVVALDELGKIYFIAVYNTRNPVSGPNLEELPEIISEVDEANDLNLVGALNLDGGAHSAFVSQFVRLSEISTMGGYFCIKP